MDEHTIGRFQCGIRASAKSSRPRQAERHKDDSKQSVIKLRSLGGVERASSGTSSPGLV